MEQPTAKTNGVSALLDEVEEAEGAALASGDFPNQVAVGVAARRVAVVAARRVAVAYVLGRRGMPLSEAPQVRHLLALRERGHAV